MLKQVKHLVSLMPYTPYNTQCSMLGCKNTKSKLNSYCIEHGGREYTGKRDGAYESKLWKATRARQLSLQPLCQGCLHKGIITAAQHVDHVFPWRQIGEEAFTRNIFQSLCPEHHSYKTGKEKKDIILHWSKEGETKYRIEDYNTQMQLLC